MEGMEKYITGTGQTVWVHTKDKCEGNYCCIHNPSDHVMKDWPTHWRDDRMLMERLCEHGIGHPDPDDLAFKARNGYPDSEGVHGCDGCCVGTPNRHVVNDNLLKIEKAHDNPMDDLVTLVKRSDTKYHKRLILRGRKQFHKKGK